MRDLVSDRNNYVSPANWRYASYTVNDVNASSGINSPYKAANYMSKRSFRSRFMYKFLLFLYFLFFSGFET